MPCAIDPATRRPAVDPLDSDLFALVDVRGNAGFGCSVLRRARITVFVLCPIGKEVVCVGGRWEIAPCTAPLLSPSERETGVCESCAAGWETDTNRLATPEEVAEHGAMAGAVWERRRGIGHDSNVARAVLGRRQVSIQMLQGFAAGV